MPRPRILPDTNMLQAFLDEGQTHEQIAAFVSEQTGKTVSAKAVSVAVSRAGIAGRRPRYHEWLPWRVRAAHAKQYPAVMLRAYGRYKAADCDPASLDPDLRVRMNNWLAMLANDRQVVDYDHEQGFVYVPRRRGEDVIRRPKAPRAGAQTRAVNQ